MRRLALWLDYDGGRYAGFQRLSQRGPQSSGQGNPRLWKPGETLQEELENKLSLILGEPVKVAGSGRTDRGVHASGQVVTCDTSSSKDLAQVVRSLQAILAPGIRIERGTWVDPKFHPRFSAVERVYHYYLWPEGPEKSPWLGPFCWMTEEKLDLEAMQRAALPLLGSHDFTSYTRSAVAGESRTRELRALKVYPSFLSSRVERGPWAQVDQMVCLEVRANAFLRRMVRQLVANLVEVGRGRWAESRPLEVLNARDCTLSAPPAPPQGLFLVHIDYGESFLEGDPHGA